MMKSKRWQDWLNLLLGAWLFASPWALGYAGEHPAAASNACVIGAAILIVAALALYMSQAWEEIVNFLLGAWIVISPWVLGFASGKAATSNMVITGILVAALAAWAAAGDRELRNLWQSVWRTKRSA